MLQKKRPLGRNLISSFELALGDGLQRWVRRKTGVGLEREGQGILQFVHPTHGTEHIPVGSAQFGYNTLGKWF